MCCMHIHIQVGVVTDPGAGQGPADMGREGGVNVTRMVHAHLYRILHSEYGELPHHLKHVPGSHVLVPGSVLLMCWLLIFC